MYKYKILIENSNAYTHKDEKNSLKKHWKALFH